MGLKRPLEAKMWYLQAIKEAPYLREAYVELAEIYYNEQEYDNSYYYLTEANKIKTKPISYINEDFCWNAYFYDLYSVVCYYTKHYEEAILNVKKAIELDPNNERLKTNLQIMEKK